MTCGGYPDGVWEQDPRAPWNAPDPWEGHTCGACALCGEVVRGAETEAADSVRSAKQGSSVSPAYILHAARNIAEACGETFGSIRNRELAKWGTSIVPKETIVDRDALLALADETDHDYDLQAPMCKDAEERERREAERALEERDGS